MPATTVQIVFFLMRLRSFVFRSLHGYVCTVHPAQMRGRPDDHERSLMNASARSDLDTRRVRSNVEEYGFRTLTSAPWAPHP